MKYLSITAVSLSALIWMACGHGRPAETSETTTPAVTPTNTTVPSQTIPVTPDGKNTATTLPTITPTGTATTGLNPEHGQPGHRCDIAVGAPLNSAPATESKPTIATPAITTTPSINTPIPTPINISADKPTQPATTTKVAPGMNPAHGEPGHRCDIAVGAPLDSKPTTPAITTTPSTTTTPVTTKQEQVIQPTPTTKVAPGMNPAHGEPGHRCDIGVGEPLSTPVKPNYTPPVENKPSIPAVVPVKPVPVIKKDNG